MKGSSLNISHITSTHNSLASTGHIDPGLNQLGKRADFQVTVNGANGYHNSDSQSTADASLYVLDNNSLYLSSTYSVSGTV
jgi:hypothetical protein